MIELPLSTQTVVRIGPFLDVTDKITPETGITLAGADEAEVLKAAGAATVSIAGNTWAAIAGADGWYDLTLTTGDTDTLGELVVVVQDDSECVPVSMRFQVVPAEWAVARTNISNFYNSVETGTAQAASTTTKVRLAAGAPATDDLFNGHVIYIYSGLQAGTCRVITDYDGTLKDATVGTMAAADATSKYVIIPSQSNMITAASLADAVWDEDIIAAHNTADTAGKILGTNLDAPISTTDTVVDTIASDLVVVDTLVDTLTTNLATANANIVTIDGLVDAIIVTLAALNDISAAEVNTEVDNALNVTTYAEPGQETPASTTTLVDKIGYLYKMMRNRKAQTATTFSLYNDDAVTVDQKSTTSDDGTTVGTTEIITGP